MSARARDAERGSATAELAVVLPGVVVVLLAVLLAGVVGAAQVSCQDAARVVARAEAIGESGSGRSVDGNVSISREGDWVHVEVRREVGVLGVVVPVSARAMVLAEPTSGKP
ncbi:TadE family type IV pilus minor pilin [Salana multivorans]